MKKNEWWHGFTIKKSMLLILRKMKLTILLICLGILSSFGSGYSQNSNLNLKLKNLSLKAVLAEIENQTDYSFLYKADMIDHDQLVDVDVSNASVSQILDILARKAGFSYKIMDNSIIVLTSAAEQPDQTQQQIRVTGKVTDSSGAPLPGVSVVVKGTTQGTITNANGNYSMINIPSDVPLVFSFVGMRTEEVLVNGRTSINITMQEETIGLDEVVAIGYGTMKKVNLTGSVSSVSSQALVSRPATNPTNLLQGRIAGLQVTQPSGQPGQDDATFQIRGLGSFGASSSPLVLIDGVAGSLSYLAPNDIENITVLKDAASASIYGSRAANGVILVTTKKAKGTSIEYRLDVGFHNATKLPDLIYNSAEYMELFNTARERSGRAALYTQEQIDAYKYATDRNLYPNFNWIDYYFNQATAVNHYLSLSGVTEKNSYKFSLNYLDQDGILSSTTSKRYNASLNFSNKITDAISIGTILNLGYKDTKEPWSGYWTTRYIYQNGPTYGPYLPDGSGRKASRAYSFEPHNTIAPIAFENGAIYTKGYSLNAQAFMDVKLYKGLVWQVKAAVNYAEGVSKDHEYATLEHYFYQKLPGEEDYTLDNTVNSPLNIGVADAISKSITPLVYSTLTYETKIAEKHFISGMVGYEQQSNKTQYLSGSRKEFPSNDLKELDAGSPNGQNVSGNASEWALRSYFGRLNYVYQNKYLLEANARYDGTSRVAKAHRWGFFPSVSAGWRVSEEKFIKDKLSWVDNLKLRASYGILGNQEIGNYPYQDILTISSYPLDGTMKQGVRLSRLTDKDLRWESTKVIDLGLDMDIYKGLFGLTFDWFKKNTFDILASLPVPGSLGLNGPITNDGELQNTGWEMELRHGKRVGEFRYDVNFIFATFKNKLLSIVTPTKGINEVGLPYNSYYMYEWDGVYQDQADIDNSPKLSYYSPGQTHLNLE
jgi:TonB-linked SusC/RagA family outer membrane protein